MMTGFRRRAEEAWLRLIRMYTYNTPIARGKYRLFLSALKLCSLEHDSLRGQATDGRRFWINLTTGMQEMVFFVGEFERAVTEIVRLLVNEGDVCVDVGANFGWYTTLFAKEAGETGEVHSFEPVPATYRELRRNYELMGSPDNVFINNLALGDQPGRITMNLFGGLPTGHASLSSQGRDVTASFECPMITLDSYLDDKRIEKVDLIKVDIEGAEMMFLNGAARIFEQEAPPIFLVEMALGQTQHFGYVPDDLVKFIALKGDYKFYAVDEASGRLQQIHGFAPGDIGANVFCMPRGRESAQFAALVDR